MVPRFGEHGNVGSGETDDYYGIIIGKVRAEESGEEIYIHFE
jgi:hypothetical protein